MSGQLGPRGGGSYGGGHGEPVQATPLRCAAAPIGAAEDMGVRFEQKQTPSFHGRALVLRSRWAPARPDLGRGVGPTRLELAPGVELHPGLQRVCCRKQAESCLSPVVMLDATTKVDGPAAVLQRLQSG